MIQSFDEYIRQGEPSQKEKAQIWQTAIGLQDIDGLRVSDYLIETAKENIEGKITIDEVQYRIESYYKQQKISQHIGNNRTEEADTVSSRISKILSNDTFSFSPVEYIAIHRQLFTGIYKFAGKIRNYNISKNEWILNGKSVLYANATEIRATLDYDFNQEKQYNYQITDFTQSIQHLVQFISDIWQIHAFGEGNTRTTAVFAIKYLRSFGFKIDNESFAKHSWYFRNALVRANYNDWTNNIHATQEFLIKFFGNLLLGENNELKNRYMRIDWVENVPVNSKNGGVFGGVFGGVNLLQKIIIDLMHDNSHISIVEIANQTGKPRRTIENNVKKLKEINAITRIGSDKTGEWKVLIK